MESQPLIVSRLNVVEVPACRNWALNKILSPAQVVVSMVILKVSSPVTETMTNESIPRFEVKVKVSKVFGGILDPSYEKKVPRQILVSMVEVIKQESTVIVKLSTEKQPIALLVTAV